MLIFVQGAGDDGNSSDESDWEPEADIQPPEREQTRSGRQRKRPSFFQVGNTEGFLELSRDIIVKIEPVAFVNKRQAEIIHAHDRHETFPRNKALTATQVSFKISLPTFLG